MATDVVMPQMGESIAEGTIVRWIKKVGDTVDRDEPLFEISTDKVDAEIPSPAAGVVSEIRAQGRRNGRRQQRGRGDRRGGRGGSRCASAPASTPPAGRARSRRSPSRRRMARWSVAARAEPARRTSACRSPKRGPHEEKAARRLTRPRPKTRSVNGRRRSSARSRRNITSTSRSCTAPASPAA